MKWTNAEKSKIKNVMTLGVLAESEEASGIFPEKTQNKKSQNHGSKRIHHAPERIPKYIIFHKGNPLFFHEFLLFLSSP